MKVYVCGPISGMPDLNRPAFEAAAETIRALGHEPVNPHEITDRVFGGDTSRPWADYMRADLRELLECEGIWLLPGWQHSRGAHLEREIAGDLGFEFFNGEGGTPRRAPP